MYDYFRIFVYHKIVLKTKTNLHVTTKDIHGTWFRWFIVVYSIFGGGYIIFFILDQVLKNYIISNAYLAVFVIVQSIFLLVYGRRITKVVEAQKQKEGKLKKFHKVDLNCKF